MASLRQNKFSRLLQKELSSYFLVESRHFQTGCMITVTIVRISPDLGEAKIYLSFFQVVDNAKVLASITDKTWEIRKWLGDRIRHQARVVPNLHFYIDDSLDYAANIERLLQDNSSPKL
ncbi:MAG: 30S ribosome-binding factor RbfA [Bacteroidia bacterium]|nr:30S ribosome-binding factor RbfA [Bacteroidia bacterium]